MRLKSYLCGEWQDGEGVASTLINPATEEVLAESCTTGLDFGAALRYAREVGGPALRALSFAERSEALRLMSRRLYEAREELIAIGMANGGNTRGDAKFDIDGATGTLAAYAGYGEALRGEGFLVDGGMEQLSRNPRYAGQHILTPLRGAAVHINAYNFPAWGLFEKAAVALLAGVPVISKPATSTAMLACRMVEIVVEAGLLPDGALSLIAGRPGDLLDHLGAQDVLAFTGSGDTAVALRGSAAALQHGMRVNVEADSLNAALLGPDLSPGDDAYALCLREVARDVTQKAGQKCTAIRRVLVPRARLDDVVATLDEALGEPVVGNPADSSVRMGPLVSRAQVEDVRAGIRALSADLTKVRGEAEPTGLTGVPEGRGFFVTPHLFRCDDLAAATVVHAREVFGPVVTVMPYDSTEQAVELCGRGGGALVSSVYSDDRRFAREVLLGLAPHHGRLTLGSAKVADFAPGPGMVMPGMVHGGPGRAGGGEELGGLRGLNFYMQRTAIQGYRPLLSKFFPASTGD